MLGRMVLLPSTSPLSIVGIGVGGGGGGGSDTFDADGGGGAGGRTRRGAEGGGSTEEEKEEDKEQEEALWTALDGVWEFAFLQVGGYTVYGVYCVR